MSDASSPPPRSPGAPALDATALRTTTGGTLLAEGRRPIRGGAVDSRRVQPGNSFFALPGERTDGHRFLEPAVAAGAAALVVTEALDDDRLARLRAAAGGDLTIVRVDEGLPALQALAAAWRDRFEPLIVGVTGSVGKTSTKEQVAETLAVRWRVLRSEGNENNEIGLPLTLLRLSPEHEAAVLEMGMYVGGEIRLLAGLARPRIGVVTAVRATHVSRAGSIEAIEAGKRELVEALPSDGTAVLNADDPRVRRMAPHSAAAVLTYGFGADADVGAEGIVPGGEAGMRFTLRLRRQTLPIVSPNLGRHSVHNALAAAAVGLAAGLHPEQIAHGLERPISAPHRSSLVRAGEWRILDDSYNAAPDSMAAALTLLGELPGRPVAVLGEMLELGEGSRAAHEDVGRRAAGVVELLVVVGEGAEGLAAGALEAGLDAARLVRAADRQDALAALAERLRPGDTILVKASRGVALDLLVDELVRIAGGTALSGRAS